MKQRYATALPEAIDLAEVLEESGALYYRLKGCSASGTSAGSRRDRPFPGRRGVGIIEPPQRQGAARFCAIQTTLRAAEEANRQLLASLRHGGSRVPQFNDEATADGPIYKATPQVMCWSSGATAPHRNRMDKEKAGILNDRKPTNPCGGVVKGNADRPLGLEDRCSITKRTKVYALWALC